ncbi:hypothetical protein B0A49_01392 [Cryomyces minteri]|uniref:Uncharacterized protein n=1 Tax=Cryomyces minteri TaxID=331657 RepID=A0A4U0XWL5_9PEZI|nr:hypothetical protein B0A49_01392 [Cryomyces minteri]
MKGKPEGEGGRDGGGDDPNVPGAALLREKIDVAGKSLEELFPLHRSAAVADVGGHVVQDEVDREIVIVPVFKKLWQILESEQEVRDGEKVGENDEGSFDGGDRGGFCNAERESEDGGGEDDQGKHRDARLSVDEEDGGIVG